MIAIPSALLLGFFTWVLLRVRAIRAFEAVIVGLFGFTLAESTFGGPIGHLIGSFFHALAHL